MTGQVAQLVERGPEKAGVGGSIPSLATKEARGKRGKGEKGNGWEHIRVFPVTLSPFNLFPVPVIFSSSA
jgi:hypothetical protein